jgi:hypothetical protein
MNPAIIEAAAAERTSEMHASAAARRRVAEIRRTKRMQRPRPTARVRRSFRALRALRIA